MHNLKDSNQLELDFERICLLYSNVKYAHFGTFLAGLFLFFFISRYSSPNIAKIWISTLVIIYIPRIIISIQFSKKLAKQEITPANIKPWEKYLTITSMAPHLCMVSSIFLPYGNNEYISTAVCGLIFMTLASGGVLALTTSLGVILFYINISMLSIVIKLIWLHDPLFIMLGVMLFSGYILVTRMLIGHNKLLIENIALKIENKQSSLVDPLTKLWNRRRLDLHIEKLFPTSLRSGDPFCLVMLDIDHFKQYNDTHGHTAGDETLVKVANLMEECSRDQDLVVRYGGEEFLVVLPQTEINNAAVITERIRRNVKDKTDVTISAGIAEFNNDTDFEQIIARADKALYTAKENGRDRYVLASS